MTAPAQPQAMVVNNNHGVVAGVVNELHVHAAPDKPTLDSEVFRYYHRLASACDVVTAQNHYPSAKTPNTQSKVEDVYVEPDVWVTPLEPQGTDEPVAKERAAPASERQPWKSCFNSDEERFQRIALLADGGMGKTTAVDREIQRLCDGQRPWLALRLPSLLRMDVGVPLPELVVEALTLDIAARLHLDRTAAEKIGHSLLNHLDRQAGVLLFDGYDEVPLDQRPDILNSVLLFLASAARKQPKHKVVLTSRPYATEPAEVQAELARHGFEQLRLAPFSTEQQAELVTRYFNVAPREQAVGRALIEQLSDLNRKEGMAGYRDTEEGGQGLAALMREPMLAAYACMLAEERTRAPNHVAFDVPLPTTRHELLDGVVELLLEKWDRKRRDSEQTESFACLFEADPLVDRRRSRLRRLVEEAALQEHLHKSEEEKARKSEEQFVPDLPADWQLQRLYEAFYLGEAHGALTADWLIARIDHAMPPELAVRARHVAQWLTQRSGLMRSELRHRADEPRMQHRQLADFLAACALGHDRSSDDHARALVEQAWFSPDWSRQMIALGFERLVAAARRPGKAANTAALCAGLEHWRAWTERLNPEDTELFTAVLAQALAQAIPADWLAEAQDKALYTALDPLRLRLVAILAVQRLSSPERAAAADALGALGDPRFAPGLWLPTERFEQNTASDEPLPGFVRTLGGTFWVGERDIKGRYTRREVSIDDDFYVARCLTTIAQYERFVVSGGYGFGTDIWGESGLKWRERSFVDKPDGWEEQLRYPHRPVTNVSWYEAQAYANWLNSDADWNQWQNQVEAWRGLRVRLLSDVQWVRTMRADRLDDAHQYRWQWGDEEGEASKIPPDLNGNGVGRVSVVGCFPPNRWGVWDIQDNALQWTCGAFELRDPRVAHQVYDAIEGDKLSAKALGTFWGKSFGADRMLRQGNLRVESRESWVGFRLVLSQA